MIKIELINCAQDPTQMKPEQSAALEIKEQFEQEFSKYPNAKGTLYILRSVSIFGYKIRDIDIILIGQFENFCLRNKVVTKNYGEICNLYIDSFICNIELKDIDTIIVNGKRTLWKEGTAYTYKYKNSGVKDITEQAFDQMHEFRKYMYDTLNIEPFMCDLIWFRALNKDQLKTVSGDEKDNALASQFSFIDLVGKLLLRMNVTKTNQTYHLDGFYGNSQDIRDLSKFLCEKRTVQGLTKKKFELLSQSEVDIDKTKEGVGDKLIILPGRAGTGKTIQLLKLAYHLANPTNSKRCLLLTYNNALVSDIRRLIDFTDMPLGIDGRTVSIQTVDSFFIQLMTMFEIIKKDSLIPTFRDYKPKFKKALEDFYNTFIDELDDKGAEALKDLADNPIDWDYILIDEGQDWPDLHKKVIFKLYGPKRIVVADGIDQFIMSSEKQDWTRSLDSGIFKKRKVLDTNLRQKTNLVEFLNAFSYELNLGWSIKKNMNLNGGQIEIYSVYNNKIHEEICKHCKDSDCENYDILILVPPEMVDPDENGDTHFKNMDKYREAGISVFDGTNSSNRHRYPSKDMARLYQYDSCRGLESWVTVCYQFDELIKYKIKTINKDVIQNSYLGLDINEGIKKYVYTWALMPLTRPVDRLVITLEDPNSEIGTILYNLSKRYDFIKWNYDIYKKK